MCYIKYTVLKKAENASKGTTRKMLFTGKWSTPNLTTNIPDFGGFDSSTIII